MNKKWNGEMRDILNVDGEVEKVCLVDDHRLQYFWLDRAGAYLFRCSHVQKAAR